MRRIPPDARKKNCGESTNPTQRPGGKKRTPGAKRKSNFTRITQEQEVREQAKDQILKKYPSGEKKRDGPGPAEEVITPSKKTWIERYGTIGVIRPEK